MKNEDITIEKRLEHMKNFYVNVDKFLDDLKDNIPGEAIDKIKKAVLGDEKLKKLIEGIDNHRAPRLFLMGRTGVGKSSLINALCGTYLAKVSDTESCTPNAEIYSCKEGDRTLMEIMDTRGIAESVAIDNGTSAERQLLNQVTEFCPDAAIFMLNCTHRDDVDKDIDFMKRVAKEYQEVNKLNLPIVVVVNKCDQMAPARLVSPSDYNQVKIDKINAVVRLYKGLIVRKGLKIVDIIGVSSLIDWETQDGIEVPVEDIENLPKNDIDTLKIGFDGRYKIDELFDILLDAIQDSAAQMGFRMALRLEEFVKRMAKQLTKTFSTISATIALTPIPISDVYILVSIQAVLVALIAALSGRDLSFETAKEFILSLGGVAMVGYGLRILAQQAAKFINGAFPTVGSAVSASIAFTGTNAIGGAATSYYIEHKDIEKVKKEYNSILKTSTK